MAEANWVANASLSVGAPAHAGSRLRDGAVLSAAMAFRLPKRYESKARIMPPDQLAPSIAMVAALTGRSSGGLGGWSRGKSAGLKSPGALYIDLLRSRTISDHLIDRFNLQNIYHKRYRIDTVKYLARHTEVVDDKKSGVISLTFSDTDPARARDIAQAYLDELNSVITAPTPRPPAASGSSSRSAWSLFKPTFSRPRIALSEFSSINATLDIKEQTHAMVEAGAKLQAEVIVGQSELDSLRQIYGEDNVRVRAARARIGELQRELGKMSGTSAAPLEESGKSSDDGSSSLYPSLRQLPKLAVPYADLYRRVRIQETVFELLSQQYEMARIEEAKDTPVVSIIDPPLTPEKKSFPPRLIVILLLTSLTVAVASVVILFSDRWRLVDPADPRKLLAHEIGNSLRTQLRRLPLTRGAR